MTSATVQNVSSKYDNFVNLRFKFNGYKFETTTVILFFDRAPQSFNNRTQVMDIGETTVLHIDENSAVKDEISFSDSQKHIHASTTKRRKKKALTTINQNVAAKGQNEFDNIGKCINLKSETRTNTEIPNHSDSESSLNLGTSKSREEDFYSKSIAKNNESIMNTTNRQENLRIVSKSSSGDNINKEKESRRLKVVLSEKDRQLASLQHMV